MSEYDGHPSPGRQHKAPRMEYDSTSASHRQEGHCCLLLGQACTRWHAVCSDERADERALVKGNRAWDAGVELDVEQVGDGALVLDVPASGEGVGDRLVVWSEPAPSCE